MNGEKPVRFRGVEGVPPTGPDPNKGEQPFWTFLLKYTAYPFENCPVDVDMLYMLSDTKDLYGFIQ